MDFWMFFGVLFFVGTAMLFLSSQERHFIIFIIRTRYFLPVIDYVSRIAPGLWKFLADFSVYVFFGGLGAAYLSRYRKTNRSLDYSFLLAGTATILAWYGGVIAARILNVEVSVGWWLQPQYAAVAFLALLACVALLSKRGNTLLDYAFGTIVASLFFIKVFALLTAFSGQEVSLFISLAGGAFGLPPLLVGAFLSQAVQISVGASDVPGVSPMVPGVNEQGEVGLTFPGYATLFVPIAQALVALVILMFSHEFAHGVLARAQGIKLKSTGLLTVGILPLGAFVEPDEEEMNKRSSIEKMRVLSAGSFANIIVCMASIFLMVAISSFLVEPAGVRVAAVIDGSTATGILEPGTIIHSVDGIETRTVSVYRQVLSDIPAKTTVKMETDRGDVYVPTMPNPQDPEKSYTGIFLEDVIGSKYGLDLGALDFVWSTLIWVIFFNFNVALVNILPLPALDGSKMLKEILMVFNVTEEVSRKLIYGVVGFCVILLLVNAFPLLGMAADYVGGLFSGIF